MLRSAAKLPISTEEFFHAFASIWPPAARSRRSDLLNVGLAISGGVDSMALAALCSKLNHANLGRFGEIGQFGFEKRQRLSFRAFIVDHGARVGSDEEALLVSKNLEQLGIPARILKLKWPNGGKPTELSNFESMARTLRYQALGKACYDHGIEPLLTAHHEGDQVETVVMRLLRGARGTNLRGMRSSCEIPECHGIYGVNRSGSPSNQLKEQEEKNHTRPVQSVQLPSISMESGGVRLYRPLLNFSKARLEETCTHLNVPWVTDKTNQDPTLTQRNAIRHIYLQQRMPKALSYPAILRLARKMEMRDSTDKTEVESMLSEACIEEINWNAGALRVRFPNFRPSRDSEEVENQKKLRIAKFLRSLINFVTPNENVALSDLGTACKAIFPEIFSAPKPKTSGIKQVTSFTTAGVQFTRIVSEIPLPSQVLQEGRAEGRTQVSCKYVWVLSRQNYSSSEPFDTFEFKPLSVSLGPASAIQTAKHWSRWHLFDGRFWIRISTEIPMEMVVGPFLEEDMENFRACPMYIRSADGKDKQISKEEVSRLMKNHLPGAIRYTIPAISTFSIIEEQKVTLALPTIGIATAPMISKMLDWEVRYKCVDEAKYMLRSNEVYSASKWSKERHSRR